MDGLEVNRYIVSRLWYTASVIAQRDASNICFTDLEPLIRSVIDTGNEDPNNCIAYALLERNDRNNAEKDTNAQENFNRFSIEYALKLLKCEALHPVHQEITSWIRKIEAKEVHTMPSEISESCVSFLEENLMRNPMLLCCIINTLLSICPDTCINIINTLQSMYIRVLKEITELAIADIDASNKNVQLCHRNNYKGDVLCILSKMHIDTISETEFFTWMHPTLTKVCEPSDIELALYTRNDTRLLTKWRLFMNKIYAYSEAAENLDTAYKIRDSLFNKEDTMISLNKRGLLRRVLQKKSHWLNDILDVCYMLMINAKYHDVASIMSCKLFSGLWLAILFKILENCEQDRTINEALWRDLDICDMFSYLHEQCISGEDSDSFLYKMCTDLKKHIRVVDWVLHTKDAECSKNESHLTTRTISNRCIFSLLQTTNVLLVLKKTLDIHEANHDDIQNLLIELCESENVFQAYRSILNALKGILLCDSYSEKYDRITKLFSDMEHNLNSVFPLSLRLETIQNIFSLVFLRRTDFEVEDKKLETTCAHSDSDNSECESETAEYSRYEFVCNKYAIREILCHLRNSLLMVITEYRKSDAKVDLTDDEFTKLEQDIFLTKKILSDAIWRLELYTSSNFVERIGVDDKLDPDSCSLDSNEESPTNSVHSNGNSKKNKSKITSDSSSSETAFGYTSGRWTKRLGNDSSPNDLTLKDTRQQNILVNLMLASKESLVLQCLWKGDYVKAQEIVAMSDGKNSRLKAEVQFSKALKLYKQDMSKQEYQSEDVVDRSKDMLKHCTLESIRMAAQEGIQSSRLVSQLETFLASQEPYLQMLCSDAIKSSELLTLSVIDLALTTGYNCQTSDNLCDVAAKYLKLCPSLKNNECTDFFLRICDLLYENKRQISTTNILCDAKISLAVNEWKQKKDQWVDLYNKYNEFKLSQNTTKTVSEKVENSIYLHEAKILQMIIAICKNSGRYLQNVHSHLLLLYRIVPMYVDMLVHSDLLKIPLHFYFGHQIFDLMVDPDSLETLADDLQVNLAYDILINTCPTLPDQSYNGYIINRSDSGCIVLNENLNNLDANIGMLTKRGPNQCVADILTELLQALHSISPSQDIINYVECKHFLEDSSIRNILNKTSCLTILDLSELSAGNETLTFLLNIWNIMFVHAALFLWSNNQPNIDLKHSISLMMCGYVIGDLGLVTLATLRSKLLGKMTINKTFFTQFDELNEPLWQDLDLVQDLRVIFAMANEFYGSPQIRVYEASTLNEELNESIQQYLNYYTSEYRGANNKENMPVKINILLPDLIRIYEKSYLQFSKKDEQQEASVNNSVLLKEYFQFEDINDWVIEYSNLEYSYDIILKYPKCFKSRPQDDNEEFTPYPRIKNNMRPSLLQYLEDYSWLLSYIVCRIHNESPNMLTSGCDNMRRTSSLENLLTSPWVENLKLFFNDNQTLAAIYEDTSEDKLWQYFKVEIEMGSDLNKCLGVINALPDRLLIGTFEIQYLKDKIISSLVSEKQTTNCASTLQYVYQIRNIHILAQTILLNINKWELNVCEGALLHVLHHVYNKMLPIHCKSKINEILRRITVFRRMLPYVKSERNHTWYDIVYCTEKTELLQIMNCLISVNEFELCLQWLDCQAFPLDVQSSLDEKFLIGLLKDTTDDFKNALQLLQSLPLCQSVKMCKSALKQLVSIEALEFIVTYLLKHCKVTKTIKYRKLLIGIDILRILGNKEQTAYIDLVKEPLLILEQLLMNCKFEVIQKILSTVDERWEEARVSLSNFDETIKFYAKKSLELCVSMQRESNENKSKVWPHSSLDVESNEFVMPVVVPTKDEWVPNDKASKCSCCNVVIFSMFNRRHHCRRCGRIVCAVCSQHRMLIPGYSSAIPVRMCNDCKRQTLLRAQAMHDIPSTTSSDVVDYWQLTKDEAHNRTIREEFSFEYAPNISLCLSILNLHSDHRAYTNFLLDRCDEMKCLLGPVCGDKINAEVDHAVIIKMIRSLLVAAKVKCAKLGFNTGLIHCDRFLSQVDLIATLVQSDCLTLIPSDDLNKSALRKLRQLLTEKEHWTLALDVSTKAAGLDTQSVWAAWGKACLKVGSFAQARIKFAHCLDKVSDEDYDDWVVLSYPKESVSKHMLYASKSLESEASYLSERGTSSAHTKDSQFVRNRPTKDPQLLSEILQILDSISMNTYLLQQRPHHQSNAAQEVLNILNNLKATRQGQFNIKHSGPLSSNIYYQESLYYLLTYGSYSSILEFLAKYEEFDKCLNYVLDNNLDPEMFFSGIYMYSLKNGTTEKLHQAMKLKDASLVTWKKYLICACHMLEKKEYLHTLYQLQLFMNDSIRAAMTCIRFYCNDANSYTDLCSRIDLLLSAQKHLESELKIIALSRRKRKATPTISTGQNVFTIEMCPSEIDKHITTISRQMEIAKFLGNGEKEGRMPTYFINLFPDVDNLSKQTSELPTLFGNQQQKIHLAVLAILCGHNVEEGFGTAFRIMQDYSLSQQKVYSLAGHVLALENNVGAIEQLIKCCHSSGAPNSHVISDHVLTHCVKLLLNRSYNEPELTLKNQIDPLVRLITDIELKISAYIDTKQLKAAYLLAVKYSRAQDIRRILKESDRIGQNAIKAICLKWLQQAAK